MSARYEQPHALRQALEDRLKAQSRSSRLPLDRLRKEGAFERLLTRTGLIVANVGGGAWQLVAAVGDRVCSPHPRTASGLTVWCGIRNPLLHLP